MVPKSIVLTCDKKSPAGKVILNTLLVIFAINVAHLDTKTRLMMDISQYTKLQIAERQFHPNTLSTMFKQLFAWFKSKNIFWEQKDFNGLQGSYKVSMTCLLLPLVI